MPKAVSKKRVVLLDAHAIIHRAYHALAQAGLTGPSGEPVGAIYGLVAMLLKIIAELRPDYLAACYDLPEPTVRHEAYEEYKGTRGHIEDDLVAQLDASRDVFEAFAIPIYEKAGFEADDLLGTIAHKLSDDPSAEVVIASGDMDTLQLVEKKRVQVYTLKKGIQDTIMYDEKAVHDRFGFAPDLIPDLKGLMGDPSDNIKGVAGVGGGSATKLIATYGSLDKLFAALKRKDGVEKVAEKAGIQKRYAQLVLDGEEDAYFSKALATIRRDAPISFKLPKQTWREGADVNAMLELCDTYGFRSLKERIRTALGVEPTAAIEEESEEDIEDGRFAQAQAMLWLIASEFTNPTLDDLLAFTKQKTFDKAYAALEKELTKHGRVADVYETIEKPLIPVVEKMEERGVLIDTKTLGALAKDYRAQLAKIEKRIYKAAGREFNVSSPKQLGEVLFDEMGLVPERQKRTAGGARSTRESELEKIKDAHPIVADVLEYRELKKLLSTYIENLPAMLDAESRLHADFLSTGTTTGRMASQNPNLQNIPIHSERGRAIRNAFVAPNGFKLVSLDYSQVELRLAAILSGDEKLCEIFRKGHDVHREVAAYVFHVDPEEVDREMRRRAKVINFGILYGMGQNALRQQLGTTTAETHAFYDEYFGQFKKLSEYLEKTKGFARKHGYTETLFGRRRQFPEIKSPLPYVRAAAERMAINAPIQGTEADIIKLAMVRIDELLAKEGASDDAHLVLQVHDELVYEVRTEKVEALSMQIKMCMESVVPETETRGVPVSVSMKAGANWGELESL